VLLTQSFVPIIWQELDTVVEELQKISVVNRLKERSVISLIGNTQMSAIILVKVRTTYTFCYHSIQASISHRRILTVLSGNG
jgi:hypothetical protein